MSEARQVIIIGAGPAGYTAGLYTARAMLDPLMFAGYASGGQLMLTSDVENYPGYPEGIGGPEMMVDLRKQAERFGLEVEDKNVERVDLSERPFKVWVEGEEFSANAIILSTGADARPRVRRSRRAGESARVPHVTASSSATRRSSSSAGVTQRWRRPTSSPASAAR